MNYKVSGILMRVCVQVLANYDLCEACYRRALANGRQQDEFASIEAVTPEGVPRHVHYLSCQA